MSVRAECQSKLNFRLGLPVHLHGRDTDLQGKLKSKETRYRVQKSSRDLRLPGRNSSTFNRVVSG